MADVFISYSTKDASSAEYVLKNLESMYLSCWMAPRDIPIGENFAEHIPPAIRNAKVFLLLYSRNSQTSKQVINEFTFATHVGLPRIAIQLDDTPLTNSSQYHIPSENIFDGNGRLVAAVREIINWIHEEIGKQSVQKQGQTKKLREVINWVWPLLVGGCACILICACCLCLMLKLFSLSFFAKAISVIIILGILAIALIKTPLLSEDTWFYRLIEKLVEAINRSDLEKHIANFGAFIEKIIVRICGKGR